MVSSNVLHFACARDITLEDVQAVASSFELWFRTPQFLIGAPSFYLPASTNPAFQLFIKIVAHAEVPLLTQRLESFLTLSSENTVVPGCGDSILLTWLTNYGGAGRTGRSYLGPLRISDIAPDPVGCIQTPVQLQVSSSWATLIDSCPSWGTAGLTPRLCLLHETPKFPSDSLDGSYDLIREAAVWNSRIRQQRRRTPRRRAGVAA